MAQTKLPPRQKMINMMYIVLVAMLALNVDKHVLKSFHLMEKNFISSAENYDQKNTIQMAGFSLLLAKEELKTKPYYDAAIEAQEISSYFSDYIDDLKTEIVNLYDGRLEEEEGEDGITSLKTPEGMEKHAYLFMVKEQGKRGKELQAKINETRDKLLELLKPNEKELFVSNTAYVNAKQANLLNALEPATTSVADRSWASINLEYQPVGALVALLTQYQTNAKALEADVIEKLKYGINQSSFIINELNAAIVPQSNYVMEGENYQADVMLIATNSTTKPKITMNGNSLNSIENGIGKINFKASGVGMKTITGMIEVADPKTGEPKQYPYEHKYQVFKPVATVSPDALNLLYRSIDNPISISVPGFSAADIQVKATNGASITGSNGHYNIKANSPSREVKVTVYAKGKSMGTSSFRVRNVPRPKPMLGGIENRGIAVTKGQLCAQNKIFATLGSDFAYDLKYKVLKYQLIYSPRHGSAVIKSGTGYTLTSAMKSLMCKAKPGDMFIIQGITAKNMKYGIVAKVDPMTITVR